MPEPSERPPIATSPLSVVLPAHNAAAFLGEVVGAWAAVLNPLERDYEILLVDDGSSDETLQLAGALADASPRVRVLHHPLRRGFGAALATGLGAAQYPLLCYAPCDRQYPPADLAKLLEQIDKVDLVVGYREWRRAPFWARWLGRLYRVALRALFGLGLPPSPVWLGREGYGRRWLARWVFAVHVHDPECSFGLFRRALFARIPIQSEGPFARVEVLAKANFLGALLTDVGVRYTPPRRGFPRWTPTSRGGPGPKPTPCSTSPTSGRPSWRKKSRSRRRFRRRCRCRSPRRRRK